MVKIENPTNKFFNEFKFVETLKITLNELVNRAIYIWTKYQCFKMRSLWKITPLHKKIHLRVILEHNTVSISKRIAVITIMTIQINHLFRICVKSKVVI